MNRAKHLNFTRNDTRALSPRAKQMHQINRLHRINQFVQKPQTVPSKTLLRQKLNRKLQGRTQPPQEAASIASDQKQATQSRIGPRYRDHQSDYISSRWPGSQATMVPATQARKAGHSSLATDVILPHPGSRSQNHNRNILSSVTQATTSAGGPSRLPQTPSNSELVKQSAINDAGQEYAHSHAGQHVQQSEVIYSRAKTGGGLKSQNALKGNQGFGVDVHRLFEHQWANDALQRPQSQNLQPRPKSYSQSRGNRIHSNLIQFRPNQDQYISVASTPNSPDRQGTSGTATTFQAAFTTKSRIVARGNQRNRVQTAVGVSDMQVDRAVARDESRYRDNQMRHSSELQEGKEGHIGPPDGPSIAGNAYIQVDQPVQQRQDDYHEKCQFMNQGLIYGQCSQAFLSQRKKDILKSYKQTVTDFAGLTFDQRLQNQTQPRKVRFHKMSEIQSHYNLHGSRSNALPLTNNKNIGEEGRRRARDQLSETIQSCDFPQPKSTKAIELIGLNSKAQVSDQSITTGGSIPAIKFGNEILSRIFSKTKVYPHTASNCSDGITVPMSFLDVLDDSTKNQLLKIYDGKSDLKHGVEHRSLTTGLLINVSATITHFKVDANCLHKEIPKNSLIDQMKAFDVHDQENSKSRAIRNQPERRSLLCHLSSLSKGVRGGGCLRPAESRSAVPLAPLAVIDDADDDTATLPAWLFKELKIRAGDPVCIAIDLRQSLAEVQSELLARGYRMRKVCLQPLQTNYIEMGMAEGIKDREEVVDGKEAATSEDTREAKEEVPNTATSGQNYKSKNDEPVTRGIQLAMRRYRVCRQGQILRFFANQKIYEFQINDISGFTKAKDENQGSFRKPFYVNCGDHDLEVVLEIGEFGAAQNVSQIETSGDPAESGISNVSKRNQRAQQTQRVENTDEGIDLDLILKERGLDIFYMEKVIGQFNQAKKMAKKMQKEKNDRRTSHKDRQSPSIKRQQTSASKKKSKELVKRISFGEQSLASKASSLIQSQGSFKLKSAMRAKESAKMESQNKNSGASAALLRNQVGLNQPKEGQDNSLNTRADAGNDATLNSNRQRNGSVSSERKRNGKNGEEETVQIIVSVQRSHDDGRLVAGSPHTTEPPIGDCHQEPAQLVESSNRSKNLSTTHLDSRGYVPGQQQNNSLNMDNNPSGLDNRKEPVDGESHSPVQIQSDRTRRQESLISGESLVARLRTLKENGLLDSLNRNALIQNNKRSPTRSSSPGGEPMNYTEKTKHAKDEGSQLIAQRLNQVLLRGGSASQLVIDEAFSKTAAKRQQRFKDFEYELLQQQYFQEYGKSLDEVFKNDGVQEIQQEAEVAGRGDFRVDNSGSLDLRTILIERKADEGGGRMKNSIRVHMHHDQLKHGLDDKAAAANSSAVGSGGASASGGARSLVPTTRRLPTRTDTQPLSRQMNFDPSGGPTKQPGADARHGNTQKRRDQPSDCESAAQLTNYAETVKSGIVNSHYGVGNNNQVPPTANAASIWIPSKAPVRASLSTSSFAERRNSHDRFGQQDEANLAQAGGHMESKLQDEPRSERRGQLTIVASTDAQEPSQEKQNQAAHHCNVVITKPPAQATEKARGARDNSDRSMGGDPEPGADPAECLVTSVGSPGAAVKIIQLKQRNAGEQRRCENNGRVPTAMSNETSQRCPSLITAPVQNQTSAIPSSAHDYANTDAKFLGDAVRGSGPSRQYVQCVNRGKQGRQSSGRRSPERNDQPFLKKSSLLEANAGETVPNAQMTVLLKRLVSGQQRARKTPEPLASICRVRCGPGQSSLHNYQGGPGASSGALGQSQRPRQQKVVNRALSKFSTRVIQTLSPRSSKDIQRQGLKADKIIKDKYGNMDFVKKKIIEEDSATNILPCVCKAVPSDQVIKEQLRREFLEFQRRRPSHQQRQERSSLSQAGSTGTRSDSILDKATLHQLSELLHHLALLEREGRFQDGIGDSFRFELSKMLEGIMAGGVDPEQIEKFKNLVWDLGRYLTRNITKRNLEYFDQGAREPEKELRPAPAPPSKRQVVNLQAIGSEDSREPADLHNDGSDLNGLTPEISPPASVDPPQLSIGQGVASDHPQDKDCRDEGGLGRDSQELLSSPQEEMLENQREARQANQSDDTAQENAPGHREMNDGNTNRGLDTLASKDGRETNIQNDELKVDAAGSDLKQDHTAPKTGGDGHAHRTSLKPVQPASLRSEEDGSLASKKSNSQVIYSKKHINQATKGQQSDGGPGQDGWHQAQEGSKKLPRAYLDSLTGKEEEQPSVAVSVENWTSDPYIPNLSAHDHPDDIQKKRTVTQSWERQGETQKNVLRVDTRVDTQPGLPADMSPSDSQRQNADIKTALRQQSGKKNLDKEAIDRQDHGELGTLDLVSPHGDEYLPIRPRHPGPAPGKAHQTPSTILGSPGTSPLLNTLQGPASRNSENTANFASIDIQFNVLKQQRIRGSLHDGADWEVLNALQALIQLNRDAARMREQVQSGTEQAHQPCQSPAQWLPIDQEYVLQKQKWIAERRARKAQMGGPAGAVRKVGEFGAGLSTGLMGGEASDKGRQYSICGQASAAPSDSWRSGPSRPSRPIPARQIVGKRQKDLKTLCRGEYSLYNHHSPSIPSKLPPSTQGADGQAGVASPNKRGFFASLTAADRPLNMHISPSSGNARPSDLCSFADIYSSLADPRQAKGQPSQKWAAASPHAMQRLNQDLGQSEQMQHVYGYQDQPNGDEQGVERLVSDPTNAGQVLAPDMMYMDQNYEYTTHFLNTNFNSHSGQRAHNQDQPVSGATLQGNAQDKYLHAFSSTTAAMMHQRGAIDGTPDPVGQQTNLILSHSSNEGGSAQHPSDDSQPAEICKPHQRQVVEKVRDSSLSRSGNPPAGAARLEDYGPANNEAGGPGGKDLILFQDAGGGLGRGASMTDGVGRGTQNAAQTKSSHAHRRVVSGGQLRGPPAMAGAGDRGSPRASRDSNASKGSAASAGLSLAGVVYVQSSKLNFISERGGDDEEDRPPTKSSHPPSVRRDTVGSGGDSQGSLRRPPDSDPARTRRLALGKE